MNAIAFPTPIQATPTISFGQLLWTRSSGALAQTLVAKTSYRLAPGECELLSHADPVVTRDEHQDDDSSLELLRPSDLVPFKACAEILVSGCAYVPAHARSVKVRVAMGPVDKSLEAFVERIVNPDGTIRYTSSGGTVELDYARAAGGWGTWNPAGSSDDTDGYGHRRLPALQPFGMEVTDGSSLIPPVGLGPIAATWPQRRVHWPFPDQPSVERLERLGALARWEEVDGAFFNVAPIDQGLRRLHLTDTLTLEGLVPGYPTISTRLPSQQVIARTSTGVVDLLPDTLFIDSRRGVCSLVWRATLAVVNRTPSPVELELQGGNASELLRRSGVHGIVARAPAMTLPSIEAGFGTNVTLGVHTELPAVPADATPAWLHVDPETTVASADAAPQTTALPLQWSPPVQPVQPIQPIQPVQPVLRPPPPGPALPQTGGLTFGQRVSQEAYARSPLPSPPPPPALPPPLLPLSAEGLSAVAASDAAADSERPLAASTDTQGDPREHQRRAIELLWLVDGLVKRIEAQTDWLGGGLRPDLDIWIDTVQPSDDSEPTKVARVLEEHTASTGAELEQPWRATSSFQRPLRVVRGTWQPSFDERETLRATMAAAHPFCAIDRRVKEAIEQSAELLGGDWRTTSAALESATAKVRDAYAQAASASLAHLDALIERRLLEERAFVRRTLAGGVHVRGLLFVADERGKGVPFYLPEAAAPELPLLGQLPIAAICEQRPQQDARDAHPSALFALALARVVA